MKVRRSRLGAAALAAVAFVTAGPLVAAASANHTTPADRVVVEPDAASGAADSCVVFAVTVTADGRVAEGTLVDVVTTEQPASAGTDVDPCGPAPVRSTDSGAAGSTDRAEYRTGSDGTLSFGITASATGTVGILVFADLDSDDARDGNEPQDDTVLYVTTRDVGCVDAQPETATAIAGEQATVLVTVTNNVETDLRRGTSSGGGNVSDSGTQACAGDTVTGVTPTVTLTGANSGTAVACTASDAAGVARCTYTGSKAGTDTLLVFVNEGGTAGKDAGEAGDTVTRTFTAAPTGLQVDLVCASAPTTEDCVTALPSGRTSSAVQLVAQVTAPDGPDSGNDRDPAPGVALVFTENGSAATVTPDCTTDAAGRCTVTLTETTPVSGEVVTVTATIRGQDPRGDLAEDATAASGERSSDTARVSWRNAPADARYVDLKPEGPFTTAAGQTREVTATVTDVNGSPVQGVQVTFTETGPGTFSTGAQVVTTTDAAGTARAVLTSGGTESGSQQVTATITTSGTKCGQAAGAGGSNQTTNPTAGVCADTEENRIAGPTAPPSPSPSPTAPAACSTPTVVFAPAEITYPGFGTVTVRATPGRTVVLYAYTRPSTVYRAVRTGPAGADGLVSWSVRPPGNTRFYAQEGACTVSPSVVTPVRSIVSINASRHGTRLYSFYGSVQPRRVDLLVSLYRRTSSGDVLTAQARTDSNGVWSLTRRFTGSGSFGFLARAGNDLVNLGGTSPVRPTVIF